MHVTVGGCIQCAPGLQSRRVAASANIWVRLLCYASCDFDAYRSVAPSAWQHLASLTHLSRLSLQVRYNTCMRCLDSPKEHSGAYLSDCCCVYLHACLCGLGLELSNFGLKQGNLLKHNTCSQHCEPCGQRASYTGKCLCSCT